MGAEMGWIPVESLFEHIAAWQFLDVADFEDPINGVEHNLPIFKAKRKKRYFSLCAGEHERDQTINNAPECNCRLMQIPTQFWCFSSPRSTTARQADNFCWFHVQT